MLFSALYKIMVNKVTFVGLRGEDIAPPDPPLSFRGKRRKRVDLCESPQFWQEKLQTDMHRRSGGSSNNQNFFLFLFSFAWIRNSTFEDVFKPFPINNWAPIINSTGKTFKLDQKSLSFVIKNYFRNLLSRLV